MLEFESIISFDFGKIDFGDYKITLKPLNTNSTVKQQFKRIYEFPNE